MFIYQRVYLYDFICTLYEYIYIDCWSYSIHSGRSWWYANHIPSLMIESVIALFLMPEHPLQWMIHSDTKAISNTFNKISLSFPASPKDVVGLRSNALITFQIHIIPRGLQPFNWRSNDFKCLIPSFLFKYLSLFLSLSLCIDCIHVFVCVCHGQNVVYGWSWSCIPQWESRQFMAPWKIHIYWWPTPTSDQWSASAR